MQLQKLVYFAHGWYLGLTGKPLLRERVEAWDWGPVVPVLYHQFKEFGSGPITSRAFDYGMTERGYRRYEPSIFDSQNEPEDVKELLDKVWQVYGHRSGMHLSRLTHQEGSPWELTYSKDPTRRGTDIPDDLIAKYFRQKAELAE